MRETNRGSSGIGHGPDRMRRDSGRVREVKGNPVPDVSPAPAMSTHPPNPIPDILAKPGSEWSEEERSRVWVWICEDAQVEKLLTFARAKFNFTADDAEDVWGDFNADRMSTLLRNYKPAHGRFFGYVLTCFRNHCIGVVKRRARIRDRIREQAGKREQRIVSQEGEIVVVDPGPVPGEATDEEVAVERQELSRKELGDLEACISALSPALYDVLAAMIEYIEGMLSEGAEDGPETPGPDVYVWGSAAESKMNAHVAAQLNIDVGTMKTRKSRARTTIEKCLEAKGWSR